MAAAPLTTEAAPELDPCRVRLAEVQQVVRSRRRVDPYRESLIAFLQPFPFDWWCRGLTFRRWPEKGTGRLDWLTEDTVTEAFEDWRGWLRRRVGHWPEGVFVVDRGAVGERLHLHALLAGCGEVKRLSAMDYWFTRYGGARVVKYDSRKGARSYLSTKYVSGKADFAFTPGFNRLAGASGLLQATSASMPLVRS